MKKGKLYGIGVGPGDSKLLTVKAVEAIRQADMIITPKTEKKKGLSLSTSRNPIFRTRLKFSRWFSR